MKRKQYTTPATDTIEMNHRQLLLAGSLNANGDSIDFSDDPTPGDPGDAAGHDLGLGDDFSWTDFRQVLLILVFTLTSLFAQAVTKTVSPAGPPEDGKKHAMKLYLKGGGNVTFSDKSKIARVTYLPGIGMKVYLVDETESVDFLYSQLDKIDYETDNNSNANWTMVGETLWTTDSYKQAWRLEYPQVSYNNLAPTKDAADAASKSQIVVKTCDPYGITYSLEWDNALIANRWTCYELHAGNTLSSASRNDDFKADPEVAVSSQLSDYSGSGFSRGHLCPSADRLCSTEQNKQTFFLTNMQPQYQSHNGGLWSRLESQVRDYAIDDSKTGAHCDTLYVVKAATITGKVTINSTEVDGVYTDIKCGKVNQLLVPKYFYMALLHYNKATDTYRALAFWTEHLSTTQPVANLGDYAISIDELEKRTGLDFFCNLPDDIEADIEAEEPDLNFWKITRSE